MKKIDKNGKTEKNEKKRRKMKKTVQKKINCRKYKIKYERKIQKTFFTKMEEFCEKGEIKNIKFVKI